MIIQKISNLFRIRRQQVFVCIDFEELQDRLPRIPISIEDITYANVHRVTDFRDQARVASFHGFLDQVQIGVYAILDSKVVGHAWAIICRDKRIKANGYFRLCSGEALIHYCNVKPSCRGCGIYQVMLFNLCNRLFNEERLDKVYIDTEVDNNAALRGMQKVGFRPLGQYMYFQFRNRLIYKKCITYYDS
ncbi:MAG: GNAT family N-acetyltransferase [Planctomycetes bacterium]|nr:GNAT family N-acetyltransferase [Planctomycetota bacterium]